MTYADGDCEKGLVAQLTQNQECQVGLVPTKGLLEDDDAKSNFSFCKFESCIRYK